MTNPFFDHPILNSPYERPRRHWELDASGQPTQLIKDERRRAEFITPIPKPKKRKAAAQPEMDLGDSKGLSTESQRYDAQSNINYIRGLVDAWRSLPNPAHWQVTPQTQRLLTHWRHHEFGGVRPFFCQIEAVETAIWLTEVAPKTEAGKRALVLLEQVNLDANPELARLALKLATGAGKTTVMAMLIAWQTVNAVSHSGSKMFTRTSDDEEKIAHNLDRLIDLQKYPFTALEIAASVDEEQVADIFVRINSEGVRLNQADFILTLMSVFWDDGRKALEAFCRLSRQAPSPGSAPSPFNHFIQPDPDQLLRVAVAIGFQRGRLKSVYQVLRGKDTDTGQYSPERRDEQFAALKASQEEVLNLTHWHQFQSCLIGAGFRSGEMISSKIALLYAYALYLIGRKQFGVVEHQLQRLIGRWFFASSLTGRYTNSPESMMDGDLNRLKGVQDAAGFVTTLEAIMANELTNDFWTVTLPSNLESSSARNPELFAYMAAQNRLGAPVLFSHKKVSDLLDPSIKAKKKALERHHLFPRALLEREGVDDLKRINQVANYALLEWPDNIDISDAAPADYVPELRSRFPETAWLEMHRQHALPDAWHTMSYDEFLVERRKLMAAVIRNGFEALR